MDMNKRISIYIERRKKIVVDNEKTTLDKNESKRYAVTMVKNLESYGYTFSKDLIKELERKNKDYIIRLYNDLLPVLKNSVGEGANMTPMYPNFPSQVMNTTDMELYLNAIIHYISLGTILPKYEVEERFPLIDNPNLKVIELGDVEDFNSIFTNLLLSKSSLSVSDMKDLEWFVENICKEELMNLIPNKIPMKETLSYITYLLMDKGGFEEKLFKLYNTATDVLRLAVSMDGGNPCLEGVIKFKSFKRKDRVFLLSLLENCHNLEEDMVRHKKTWKNLGRVLHPGQYKDFKRVNRAFYKLRNNKRIYTFNSQLEEAFEKEDRNLVVDLLSKRPGEFARNLDRAIRMIKSFDVFNQKALRSHLVSRFGKVAKDVSTPILLQLISYFRYRKENDNDIRVFFPKGQLTKSYTVDNDLDCIEPYICDKVVDICSDALLKIYKEKGCLGKVYVDEELKNYIVPTSQRNASKTLLNVARGSRFKVDEKFNNIRAFIYWEDIRHESVDIDLSAFFCDKEFNEVDHISYTHLRNKTLNACHSGDITSAPNGASEYIDIDFEKALQEGVKYIIVSVYAFSSQPFCDLPVCFSGFMEREDTASGEIFEAKTVKNKSDLTTTYRNAIPIIIDVENKEVVWADMGAKTEPYFPNNVENNKSVLINTLKAILYMNKPNMYDLAMLHAMSRGEEIVNDIEEADTLFLVDKDVLLNKELKEKEELDTESEQLEECETVEEKVQKVITPYDTDIIISEYL